MSLDAIHEQFPISQRFAYFNHAAIGPLPRSTADAMGEQIRDVMQHGVHGYEQWVREYDRLRQAAAAMLHCDADEIAITKNTSEGLLAVANGIDWRPGDVVVGVARDFPANYVPWMQLVVRRDVRFRSLKLRDGSLSLQELDEACRGARLAALSYVHFLTGFRWDLRAVGEICRRRNCLLAVDAVQGMGAFEIDVKACGIHALAASAHKWLLGPEGCAVLYLDRDWMPSLRTIELGWTSIAGFENFRSDGDLQPTARRFECGTLNTVGCVGMRASLELLNGIPEKLRSDTIHGLAERFLDGAWEKGYEIAAERDRGSGSGIVSIRKPSLDSSETVQQLLADGVSVAERLGWIRVAPHVYNTVEQIDRLVDLLP